MSEISRSNAVGGRSTCDTPGFDLRKRVVSLVVCSLIDVQLKVNGSIYEAHLADLNQSRVLQRWNPRQTADGR